jgi:hypothetical protein
MKKINLVSKVTLPTILIVFVVLVLMPFACKVDTKKTCAMSAWSVINALLGLTINQEVYSFSPKVPQDNLKLFFAFPGATAFFVRTVNGTNRMVFY